MQSSLLLFKAFWMIKKDYNDGSDKMTIELTDKELELLRDVMMTEIDTINDLADAETGVDAAALREQAEIAKNIYEKIK